MGSELFESGTMMFSDLQHLLFVFSTVSARSTFPAPVIRDGLQSFFSSFPSKHWRNLSQQLKTDRCNLGLSKSVAFQEKM